MKKVIYKYLLTPGRDVNEIEAPVGSRILSCGNDSRSRGPAVWMLCDYGETQMEKYDFYCYGTGWDVEWKNTLSFIGTVCEGVFRWHIFYDVKR